MRAIKPIKKNEQIYNTYGNLPNSDLLRRYGYVLSDSRDNIVEISAEMIVSTITSLDVPESLRFLLYRTRFSIT